MNRLNSALSSSSDFGANVPETFEHLLKSESELATAVAAIKTLLIVLEKCNAKTLQELIKILKEAVDQMKKEVDCSACSVQSGCELFLRFITLASRLEEETFEGMRSKLLEKGNIFLEKMMTAREKIAKNGAERLPDGARILVHSRSRSVFATLKEAHEIKKKRLFVYITECASNDSGILMKKDLDSIGIPCTLVLDSSVGYILEQVDLVMFGAEGVVESGGIVNKIGTYTIAICAKMLNKPVYVLCESFKFVRMYPLNQKDLKDEFKYHASTLRKVTDLSQCHPLVDYTNPSLITLLFTDLGILTPSAVSDELIKLYL